MCEFLFQVQQKNRLQQKGLLKRFSINCYGKQATLGSIREEKAKKFEELKDKRGSDEWNEWFLRYVPEKLMPKKPVSKKTVKKRTKPAKKTRKKKVSFFFG
jgi:hypothetical protein